ncbi:unnamed protein product, partial [Nesidiocoris tenuis]
MPHDPGPDVTRCGLVRRHRDVPCCWNGRTKRRRPRSRSIVHHSRHGFFIF